MRLSDFVVREAILPKLVATTKDAAIREMVESLRSSGHLKNGEQENIIKAIMKREQLGSTGIGRGVAIPHTKHESAERLIGTVAVSHVGVPFDSLDSEPVFILVMLISPQDRPGEHLRALENVSRNLRDDTFCRFLRQATTSEGIWELLLEVDQGVQK
jgi:PTS system fructose-specific IIA component/PTS system nitrogen regulatory IIA component